MGANLIEKEWEKENRKVILNWRLLKDPCDCYFVTHCHTPTLVFIAISS